MDFKQIISSHYSMRALNEQTSRGILTSFFGLQLIDVICGNLVGIGSGFKSGINSYINNRIKRIEKHTTTTQTAKASIVFFRDYTNTDENQVYIDAIINHISKLNSVIKLQRRKIYVVNSYDEFDITKDIKGRVKQINMKDKQIDEIIFEVYSYTITLGDIRDWIDDIYEIYKTDMQNGFGKYKYYFNHKYISFDAVSQHILFDMTKFETNKSLNNLFGDHITEVNNRLRMFQDKKKWYEAKGIPYTFGLLLHGSPGCGKTSLIKAIAKDTNRHIINIKLNNDVTLTQLRNLFYCEKMKVFSDINTPPQYINIPIDQRIYVMEDVDCLTDILNKRKLNNKGDEEEKLTEEDVRNIKMLGKDRWKEMKQLKGDSITLSDILNIIDGVLETPGRILILTSNFPEKLDKALLRPGRIDLLIHFNKCDKKQLSEMFKHFYDHNPVIDTFDFDGVAGLFTPAYVQEIFLRNIHSPDMAYDILKNGGSNTTHGHEDDDDQEEPPPVTGIEYHAMKQQYYDNDVIDNKLLNDVMNNPDLISNYGGGDLIEDSGVNSVIKLWGGGGSSVAGSAGGYKKYSSY